MSDGRASHPDDDIELYALGMLEPDDCARVDAHAALCLACLQRLGRAESTVASMLERTIAHEPAPAALRERGLAQANAGRGARALARKWPTAFAFASAAALLAVVAGSLAQQNAQLRSDLGSDGATFRALVHSHFDHAQFVSLDGAAVDAKVVYERHGGWYEIVADRIDPATRVAVVRGGVVTPVMQGFARRGDALHLTLPALGAVDEMRLVDTQGRTLANARIHLLPVAR